MKAWISFIVAFVIIENICDAKRVKRHGDEHHGCDDGEHGIEIDLHGESDWKCMEDKKWAVDDGAYNVDKKCYTEEPAYHVCIDQPIDSLYKSDIPHSGPHRKVWAQYGEYNYLPPGRYVHNLEHGGVVFMYHPCAPVEMVEKLRQTATSCLYRYIVTAFPKLTKEYPFAVLTYGCIFRMSQVDASDIKNWIRQRFGHSPEPDVFGNGKYNHGLLTESFDPGSYDYNDVTKPFCPDVPEDAIPVVASLPPAFHNSKETDILTQEINNKKSSLQQNTFPDTTVIDWRNFAAKFGTQNNLKTRERGYEITSIPSHEEWQNYESTSSAEEKEYYPPEPTSDWKNFDANFPTENNADGRERPVPNYEKEQIDWRNSAPQESDLKESNFGNIPVESNPKTKPTFKPLDTSTRIDANEHLTSSASAPHAKESDPPEPTSDWKNFDANFPTENNADNRERPVPNYEKEQIDLRNSPSRESDLRESKFGNIPVESIPDTKLEPLDTSAGIDANEHLMKSESAPHAKESDMKNANFEEVPFKTSSYESMSDSADANIRPMSNEDKVPVHSSTYSARLDTNELLLSSESTPYGREGGVEVSNFADVPHEIGYETMPNPAENELALDADNFDPPRPWSNKAQGPDIELKDVAVITGDSSKPWDLDFEPQDNRDPSITYSTSATMKSAYPLTSVNIVDFSVAPSSDQVPVYFWGAVALGSFVIGLLLGACAMNNCKTKREETMKRYKVWSDRNSADSFSIAAVVRKIPDSFMNRKQNDDYQRLEANDQSSDDENPV